MSELLKNALSQTKGQQDWIGIRELKEHSKTFSFRDGKPEHNDRSVNHGVMVEVLSHGQFGYAATSTVELTALRSAIDRATQAAERASRYAVFSFTPEQRPATQARYESPRLRPLQSVPTKDISDRLRELSEKLKTSDEIIRTQTWGEVIEAETTFVSSTGAELNQSFSYATTDLEVTARRGSDVQKRTDGGMRGRCYQGGWEYLFTDEVWIRAARVSEQALELLSAENCPNETLDLVLLPDQMMLQIHESIGHPLEIDRILGDERNYAGWSFVNLKDFGNLRYGSEQMNVTFDPTPTHEFASYAFDDTGHRATREFLIQKGVLLRGLGSLESQVRSKIPGVANARATSWNRAPIDRMANINLEPGTSTFEQMISSIERGVMMESNRSWSIDDFRNKFQFGCEYARLIENGRITRTLKNPNYRGETIKFWSKLKMVGTKDTFQTYGTPFCGKGEPNQVIRVGHGSPTCLFQGVEVFGGGT